MNIDSWYFGAIREILTDGAREVNKRTGKETASVAGMTFRTDLEKDGFPLLSLRRIPAKNFVAEQMWFLNGTNRIEWLSAQTKIWDSFAEEDGTVSSAYGYRWKSAFGLDQVQTVIDKLRADPSSRHGVVTMWNPHYDLTKPQKNVPCPYSFVVNIIGGRLNLHLNVRSNDMVLGFPTDAAGFAFLLMILAQELKVRPGVYTHSISNAHVYSDHYDAAAEMEGRYFYAYDSMPKHKLTFELPKGAYQKARSLDMGFLTDVRGRIAEKYKPLDPIEGLTVSL